MSTDKIGIGIDLGTTYSCIWRFGKMTALKLLQMTREIEQHHHKLLLIKRD